MQQEVLINQRTLSDRWSVSERTLERWRWRGHGPRYIKLGNRVMYKLEDVEDYENVHSKARITTEDSIMVF